MQIRNRKFIEKFNKLKELRRERKTFIDDEKEVICQRFSYKVNKGEISLDLNFIGKILIEKLVNESKFKLEKTWVGYRTCKLFIENNKLQYREYNQRSKNTPTFLHDSRCEIKILELLPDNFKIMVNKIKELLKIYEEEIEEKYLKKTEEYLPRWERTGREKWIEVYSKKVDIPFFYQKRYGSGLFEEDKVVIIKIEYTMDERVDKTKYQIKFLGIGKDKKEYIIGNKDSLTFLTNNKIFNQYKNILKVMRNNEKKLNKEIKTKQNKIYEIMEKYGYYNLLGLRGL